MCGPFGIPVVMAKNVGALVVPLNKTELAITRDVVNRFLNLHQPSPHSLLVRKYRSRRELQRLCDLSLLKKVEITDEEYLPLFPAFHYCGDADTLQMARTSVEIVLHVLQNLFDVELDKTKFVPADVQAHAEKMYDLPPTPEQIKLGLYLARELGVLSGYGESPDRTELVSLQISDSIVELHDISQVWDEQLARRSVNIEDPPESEVTVYAEEVTASLLPIQEWPWSIIHPEIIGVAKSRFESEHYADAAEAAFKSINERLKRIVRERLGKEYDGVTLMERAFSGDKPVLELDDISTMTGRDTQVGYQQLFSGAMRGIRNPKAHSNIHIDPVRSIHFIFLASLLMSKVDEALALEGSPASNTVLLPEERVNSALPDED